MLADERLFLNFVHASATQGETQQTERGLSGGTKKSSLQLTDIERKTKGTCSLSHRWKARHKKPKQDQSLQVFELAGFFYCDVTGRH